MDSLFFMTANRFQKSWLRRLVDEVRADPEGWFIAGRRLGWTDTYNRMADQIAVDAYLEANRAGFSAYAPLPPHLFAQYDWGSYWEHAHAVGIYERPPTPGKMCLMTMFVRGAYPTK